MSIEISGLPQPPELQRVTHGVEEFVFVTRDVLLPIFDMFATPAVLADSFRTRGWARRILGLLSGHSRLTIEQLPLA